MINLKSKNLKLLMVLSCFCMLAPAGTDTDLYTAAKIFYTDGKNLEESQAFLKGFIESSKNGQILVKITVMEALDLCNAINKAIRKLYVALKKDGIEEENKIELRSIGSEALSEAAKLAEATGWFRINSNTDYNPSVEALSFNAGFAVLAAKEELKGYTGIVGMENGNLVFNLVKKGLQNGATIEDMSKLLTINDIDFLIGQFQKILKDTVKDERQQRLKNFSNESGERIEQIIEQGDQEIQRKLDLLGKLKAAKANSAQVTE